MRAAPAWATLPDVITNADDLQTYADAWNAHDAEAILAYFVDDCEYESVATRTRHRGKADLRGFLERAFASIAELRIEITSALVADGSSVSEWTMRGRSPDGHTFSVRGVSIGTLDADGRIRTIRDYWNPAELGVAQPA